MSERLASLPADERCCAETLAYQALPQLVQGFAMHACQHGLTCARYSELWTEELLVQAVLGFMTARREGGFGQHSATTAFALAAKRA